MWEFDDTSGASGPRIDPKESVGHLVLVWAIGYIDHYPTRFSTPDKKSDVIVVDAVDLDLIDPDTNQPGLLARLSWWRQGQLIGTLKPKIGGNPVLGKIGRGIPTRGQAPYILDNMKDDAMSVRRANAWLQAHPNFQPTQNWTPPGVPGTSQQQPEQAYPQAAPSQLELLAQQASGMNPGRAPSPEALYNQPQGGRPPLPPAQQYQGEPPF